MGCDIHTIVEVKKNGTWQPSALERPVFNWRHYGMFAFLAGVRNYSEVPPLFPPKGWPEDVSDEAKQLRAKWEADAHRHTWFTLSELLRFDYDLTFEDRRDGTRVVSFREFLGIEYFEDLKWMCQLWAPDDVRVLIFFDN